MPISSNPEINIEYSPAVKENREKEALQAMAD